MRAPVRLLILTAAVMLLNGCSALTHIAASPDAIHGLIHWRTDYATAQAEARATDRPMLAILVAGARTGEC